MTSIVRFGSLVGALCLGLIAACDAPPSTGSCTSSRDCTDGLVCRESRCVSASDAGPTSDAALEPGDAPITMGDDAPGLCGVPCPPGEACVSGTCEADCRLPSATPCEVPLLCGPTSGTCVMPGEECTPRGEFVPCGDGEFPPTCGPGARCEGARCVADTGCSDVVCNAVGVCVGIGCAGSGMGGEVRDVALDPIADASVGATVTASATVTGAALCGLTATFELRREISLVTTAYNDDTIWEIDLGTGARTAYATGLGSISGIANDARGQLYVVSGACQVGRVAGAAGARTFERVGDAPAGCSRMTIGPDGALYVAGGLSVNRIDLFAGTTGTFTTLTTATTLCGSSFLTGLAFDRGGALYLAEHWPNVYRVGVDGTESLFASAPLGALACGDVPWNEGLTFGPDDRLYVGVFPSNNQAGLVWSVAETGGTGTFLLGLSELRAAVPETTYAGIHGVTFGLDGSLYFTNQNTSGSTLEPRGQVFVREMSGAIRALASGLNFDWPRGYDGDLIVNTEIVSEATVPIDASGRATAMLTAPSEPGPFVVRVLVTDPTTGRILSASDGARAR